MLYFMREIFGCNGLTARIDFVGIVDRFLLPHLDGGFDVGVVVGFR